MAPHVPTPSEAGWSERMPLSLGDEEWQPWSCDWGHCSIPAVAERWAWDLGYYLAVCGHHLTGDPVKEPEAPDPRVCSLGHVLEAPRADR